MSKFIELMKNWKIWLMIVMIVFAIVAINPDPFAKGAQIQFVAENSSAQANGLKSSMVISSLNGESVDTAISFSQLVQKLTVGSTATISTDDGDYKVLVEQKYMNSSLGLTVEDVKTSNLKEGLELIGGVRVLLKPVGEVSAQTMQDVISITEKRLNTYGVSDINVRQVSDLQGNDYILIEVPGSNKEEVSSLLQKQGKFEAKIGNTTIFNGGTDIKGVCRSPDCSGIDTTTGCGQSDAGWSCRYQFRVDISPEAAKRHADATKNLGIITEGSERYLDQKLDLYLDDELVSSLFISEDLKGSETTSFIIQGPGAGATKQDAQVDAFTRMKEMQTILITGSLPVKLEVAKMDIVSPTLGEDFLKMALLTIGLSFLAVGAVIFARYRKLKIAIPIMMTCVIEVLITLGIAALIKVRIDLAAIAGIVVVIGTGVDDQIVIVEEILSGDSKDLTSDWKQKMKNAFFIIFACYFATVVSMAPLWWIGAGLVKGFAVTTIVGVTAGVLVTRPAFAKAMEIILKD